MSDKFRTGDEVRWNWGEGTASGTIKQIYTEDVTREIAGSEIKRTASDDEPAYLIRQDDGDEVLKSETEIERNN
jgi:hypothetical protein